MQRGRGTDITGTDSAVDWPLAGLTIPGLLSRAAAAAPDRAMVTFTDDLVGSA